MWGLWVFLRPFCGVREFITINNPKMLIVFFILMSLSSSVTVTEGYFLCLSCFHIRRNKKIELETIHFIAVAI